MPDYKFDHIHLRSCDPDAMGTYFEKMFGAEVRRDIYPPGTLYPGQMRVRMKVGGQTVLVAPKHPTDKMAYAPPFPYYGLEHFGFTVPNLDEAVVDLRAKGAEIAVGPVMRSPGLYLAFVRGPEGIMVELVQR
ncbi:MAG: VOC family protein [Acetobacteraceae bacterium]|nr:VOC family protein [Acetobacteraceae bacterium]